MNRKSVPLVFALSVLVTGAVCASKISSGNPPTYACDRADSVIAIDGKLDEPAWNRAAVMKFRIPVTGAPVKSVTEVRALWDDTFVYFGLKAYDKDIWSYLTARDSRTCDEDCLEVFFQPDLSKLHYHNFEINALGTVYDAYALNRFAGGGDCHRWARWNCSGLQVGVKADGTMNDPTDVDSYWCLELAIPFSELPDMEGQAPRVGGKWKFHVARYEYSIYLPEGVELSSSARLTAVDFHNLKDWMNLEFVDSK